jgi:hypothetical protein
MTEIVSCPSCGKKLQVPDDFFGKTVQCPECKQTFRAEPTSTAGSVSATAPPPAPSSVPEWEKPPAKTRDDDDERPRRRRRKDDDDDDDRDERPRRRYLAPHRAGMILTFGIMAVCGIVPIIFGPMAWVMGGADLREMRAGRMDPSGEGMTQAGRIMGIISVALMIIMLLLFCVFFGIGMIAAIGGAAHHPHR